jgi:hypothetical protein
VEFSRVHLQKWMVAFFESLASQSRLGLYRAIGLWGAAFMREQLCVDA